MGFTRLPRQLFFQRLAQPEGCDVRGEVFIVAGGRAHGLRSLGAHVPPRTAEYRRSISLRHPPVSIRTPERAANRQARWQAPAPDTSLRKCRVPANRAAVKPMPGLHGGDFVEPRLGLAQRLQLALDHAGLPCFQPCRFKYASVTLRPSACLPASSNPQPRMSPEWRKLAGPALPAEFSNVTPVASSAGRDVLQHQRLQIFAEILPPVMKRTTPSSGFLSFAMGAYQSEKVTRKGLLF